jgi:hypothetical protein
MPTTNCSIAVERLPDATADGNSQDGLDRKVACLAPLVIQASGHGMASGNTDAPYAHRVATRSVLIAGW